MISLSGGLCVQSLFLVICVYDLSVSGDLCV